MPTNAEKAAMYRASRKAKEAAQAEQERKVGIGVSSGPASACRSLGDDPAARAAAEETLQRLKERTPRRGAPPWPR